MSFTTDIFQAYTSNSMEASDVYLPLSSEAATDLARILAEDGSYTYLTLKDNVNYETVKAYAQNGYIILCRGLGGTTATKHPYGTCVTGVSPTIAQVIKDLLCCSNSDEAELTIKASLAGGTKGEAYTGWIYCTGTPTLTITVTGVPSWGTVTKKDNMVMITGTPTASGTSTVICKVTNSEGSLTKNLTLTVN